MLQLIKTSYGVNEIIIQDCLTEKRANEFLEICENNNSFPLTIQFKIIKLNGNCLTYEELEKRQKNRKVC